MKDDAKSYKNEVKNSALDNQVSSSSDLTSDLASKKHFIYLLNNIGKLPIIKFAIILVAVICLVFIIGKLINQYDLTSVCLGWNCNIIQNSHNCSTKHLLSLSTAVALALFSGIGVTLLPAVGALIAPSIAGILTGAGVFAGSTLLLNFLISC